MTIIKRLSGSNEEISRILYEEQLQLSQYIDPLKKVAARFQKELASGGEKLDLEGEGLEQAKADVGLLEKVIEWVEGATKKI